MIKNLFLVFISLFIFVSCTQERQPCLTPKIASFNIDCVHLTTDTSTIPVDTGLPHALFGAFTQNGIVAVVYPQQATFTLSLSSIADSCSWLFTTDSLNNPFDTLNFYYKRQLQFLSNACGFTYFYNLDSFHSTHHNIDSAFIITNSVTNNVKPTHFKIYIHPNY